MCVPADSTPPIPVQGGSGPTRDLILESLDGNRFNAHEAFPETPGSTAVIVLPDVRGLFPFYEQLADRFAEQGHRAIAIDYFGRTAGVEPRDAGFDYRTHVARMTFDELTADVAAASAHLRIDDEEVRIFTVGFCLGGSNSWYQASTGLGISGAIGFYGNPGRERPPGGGTVIERVEGFECPVLGLMAGDDPSIPAEIVEEFTAAMNAAGVENEMVVYQGAPHSFFDRKYEEFAAESADAWERVLAFIDRNS